MSALGLQRDFFQRRFEFFSKFQSKPLQRLVNNY